MLKEKRFQVEFFFFYVNKFSDIHFEIKPNVGLIDRITPENLWICPETVTLIFIMQNNV